MDRGAIRSTGKAAASGATLLRALAAHRLLLAPRVRAQLRRRSAAACRIPDPALRAAALSALELKRRNVEAVAVFALLAPCARRAAALRAIVALQVAVDYLDTLEESGADASGRPADGGYLDAVERDSREAVASLPSYRRVSPLLDRAVERCKRGQRQTHAVARGGSEALREWAGGLPAPPGYLWWEVAAGASSSVAAHALIAAAADPRTAPADAELLDAAYFPPIGALTVLLDDLVDLAADAAAGEHSYVAYCDGPAAADRLAFLVLRARAAILPLRRRRLHAAILAGVVGYHLASLPASAPVRARLLDAAGPAARLVALLAAPVDLP